MNKDTKPQMNKIEIDLEKEAKKLEIQKQHTEFMNDVKKIKLQITENPYNDTRETSFIYCKLCNRANVKYTNVRNHLKSHIKRMEKLMNALSV